MARFPHKILIRGVNWIGDAMMTIPALRELGRLFPESTKTLLINEPMGQLFRSFSAVDRVMDFTCRTGIPGLKDRLALLRKLRPNRFDLCLILPNSFDSALIPFLAAIPERVGFDRDGRGFLLTQPIPSVASERGRHQAYHYLDLVSALGPVKSTLDIGLDLDPKARHWAMEALAPLKEKSQGPVIGLNPGAAYGPAKQWFPERFGELGRRLASDLGAGILIVGGPTEKALGASIAGAVEEGMLDLSGRTTLPQLAAVLARCDLIVTNDSGPMHLASAVGVPVVAVFGPTDPRATSPMGRHRIVRKACECAPCMERICPRGDTLCMKRVAVDDVLVAVKDLLSDRER
ncbi:MAG: lipopolysaccharide heptosyltransferase II [bacterium]|nr:lipopolysaccharide heptosyltransferase II [bacterium]